MPSAPTPLTSDCEYFDGPWRNRGRGSSVLASAAHEVTAQQTRFPNEATNKAANEATTRQPTRPQTRQATRRPTRLPTRQPTRQPTWRRSRAKVSRAGRGLSSQASVAGIGRGRESRARVGRLTSSHSASVRVRRGRWSRARVPGASRGCAWVA